MKKISLISIVFMMMLLSTAYREMEVSLINRQLIKLRMNIENIKQRL